MSTRTISRSIRKKLSAQGVEIRAASAADSAINSLATVGNRAVRETKRVLKDATRIIDQTRAAVHAATAPRSRRR